MLTAQIIVAWAGEKGEHPRLGWWRTDLISDCGGKDLFQRLLPNTWEWAVLRAARESATRHDAMLRNETHNADVFISLYNLGFEIDERLNERLTDLSRSNPNPQAALPGLREWLTADWNQAKFLEWLDSFGSTDYVQSPAGRWIKGNIPHALDQLVNRLIGALNPISPDYPLPHFRRST